MSWLENDVFIEFKLNAYLDAVYIPDEQARLDMYKKIAAVTTQEEASDVYDELVDRYGDIPPAASNLIEIALVKQMAGTCGFHMVKQKDDMVLLYYRENAGLPLSLLSRVIQEEKGKLMFSPETPIFSKGERSSSDA